MGSRCGRPAPAECRRWVTWAALLVGQEGVSVPFPGRRPSPVFTTPGTGCQVLSEADWTVVEWRGVFLVPNCAPPPQSLSSLLLGPLESLMELGESGAAPAQCCPPDPGLEQETGGGCGAGQRRPEWLPKGTRGTLPAGRDPSFGVSGSSGGNVKAHLRPPPLILWVKSISLPPSLQGPWSFPLRRSHHLWL